MSFKAAIRDQLVAMTGVTAYTSGRIYSFPAPQGVDMPYIMISLVDRLPSSPGCAVKQPTYEEHWQLDIYADKDADAEAIYDVIDGDETSGLVSKGSVNWGSAGNGFYKVYQSISFDTDDLSELEDNGSENRIVRKALQLHIIRNKEQN